jgi:hypothetical protein
MTKKKAVDVVAINLHIDKYLITKELQTLAEGSGIIAKYIDDKLHYGRALGFADGQPHSRKSRIEFLKVNSTYHWRR